MPTLELVTFEDLDFKTHVDSAKCWTQPDKINNGGICNAKFDSWTVLLEYFHEISLHTESSDLINFQTGKCDL